MEYEDRIVAYIDILGFKNLVDSSKSLETDSIQKILERMNKTKKDNYDYKFHESYKTQVTTFSDNIVISYPADNIDNLLYVLWDVLYLQIYMVGKDTLLRGGITIGKIIHNSEMVYGPAMNDAYRLESEIAIYPRIIIDDNKIIELIDEFYDSDKCKVIEKMLNFDIDGCFYIDYLDQREEIDEIGDEYFEFLSQIRKMIKNGLKNDSIKVLKKYEWLRLKYNEIIKKEKIKLSPIKARRHKLLKQGETGGEIIEYQNDKVAYLEELYEISIGKKAVEASEKDRVSAILKATGRKERSKIMRMCAIAGVSLECYYSYKRKQIP